MKWLLEPKVILTRIQRAENRVKKRRVTSPTRFLPQVVVPVEENIALTCRGDFEVQLEFDYQLPLYFPVRRLRVSGQGTTCSLSTVSGAYQCFRKYVILDAYRSSKRVRARARRPAQRKRHSRRHPPVEEKTSCLRDISASLTPPRKI